MFLRFFRHGHSDRQSEFEANGKHHASLEGGARFLVTPARQGASSPCVRVTEDLRKQPSISDPFHDPGLPTELCVPAHRLMWSVPSRGPEFLHGGNVIPRVFTSGCDARDGPFGRVSDSRAVRPPATKQRNVNHVCMELMATKECSRPLSRELLRPRAGKRSEGGLTLSSAARRRKLSARKGLCR